jgi:hypothetical protein
VLLLVPLLLKLKELCSPAPNTSNIKIIKPNSIKEWENIEGVWCKGVQCLMMD